MSFIANSSTVSARAKVKLCRRSLKIISTATAPAGEVKVGAGAWNTGWHHGADFLQWTGSRAQKDALARLRNFSESLRALEKSAKDNHLEGPPIAEPLEQARWRLLRAETSCNLFWGEGWVPRIHSDLDEARFHLDRAAAELPKNGQEI